MGRPTLVCRSKDYDWDPASLERPPVHAQPGRIVTITETVEEKIWELQQSAAAAGLAGESRGMIYSLRRAIFSRESRL